MRKLRGLFITLFVVCAMLPSFAAFRQTRKPPKTVVDFFLLLPKKTVEPIIYAPTANRRQILKEQQRTVDIPHGYLEIRGEADSTLTVCLFRKRNGSYLVASYFGGGEDDAEPELNFFEFRAGHMVKVKPLPVAFDEKLAYYLPRNGTMITVKNEKGRRVYGLSWDRTRFVIMKW